jgi:Lar family restriction alleviation protein
MKQPRSTLSPCPFCASRKVSLSSHAGPARVFEAECGSCGATGPTGLTAAEAIELWNTRRQPSGDGDGQH